MIEIALFIALLGSAIAGLWDLKTTEVPDEIPFLMIFFSIVIWFIFGVSTSDFAPLFYSLLIGSIVLLVGLAMYHKNQWGEADAWIVASIFYAVPIYNGFLIIDYLPNLLIVSTIYLIIYSVILGIFNKKIFSIYKKDLIQNKIKIALGLFGIFLLSSVMYLTAPYQNIKIIYEMTGMLVFFLFFWRYAKVIENDIFKREIPVKELKTGDVLVSAKWVGLTPNEIMKLSKTHKTVVIKEGVRFVPVFFLTLIVTMLYGNLLFMFLF